MLRWILASMLLAPAAQGGPATYYKWLVAQMVLALLALVAWGIAPIGLWLAWGPASTLFWLVPTTAFIFAMAFARSEPGGG